MVLFSPQKTNGTAVGSNFSLCFRKMLVKKSIFSICIFSRVKVWDPLTVVLILDINLLSSFLECRSLTVNVFIYQKTLSMVKVYMGYNLNAQTHSINSPAWSDLRQSYDF